MILNDNSTQQINTLVIQLQNKITNLTNEFRKLNNSIDDLNSEISDLEKRISSNENDADNNIGDLDSKISDLEKRVSSNENNAAAMNSEILANTEAISGKADKIHTHTKSDITDFPTSLKNPNALTINGKTYDGSEAVDAGVQKIENGGTGATTALGAFENLANGLPEGSGPLDTEHIIFQNENRKNWGLYTLSHFWEYIKGKISSVLGLTKDSYGGKASTAGTADKTVDVVDFNDTSKTIRIGYEGPSITADKLLHLAGYIRDNSSFVKLKDVNDEELIKWLGIPRIKYADYQTPTRTFTQFEQVPIELSKFSSEVTPNNVLCFMVIYWIGVQLIASADWGNDISSGLKCALIALKAGTGSATIRCVYMV